MLQEAACTSKLEASWEESAEACQAHVQLKAAGRGGEGEERGCCIGAQLHQVINYFEARKHCVESLA